MDKNNLEFAELATDNIVSTLTKTTNTNDKLHLLFTNNGKLKDPLIYNSTWLEIFYFGSYLFYKKQISLMTKDDADSFLIFLIKESKHRLMDVVFNFSFTKEEKEALENQIGIDYLLRFNLYSQYKNNIAELLYQNIREIFNTKSKKIKFFKNSFRNRFLFNFFSITRDKNSIEKHDGGIFYPDSVLIKFCDEIGREYL